MLKGIVDKVQVFFAGDMDDDYDDEEPIDREYSTRSRSSDDTPSARKKRNNVIEFDTSRAENRVDEDMTRIIIVRPTELEDATLICDHLRNNDICIINVQGIEMAIAQRLADYLAGVSYALNGKIERIDDYIFVIAPETASITSDLMAKLKTDDTFLKRQVAIRG